MGGQQTIGGEMKRFTLVPTVYRVGTLAAAIVVVAAPKKWR
jgi:hypothetical protein